MQRKGRPNAIASGREATVAPPGLYLGYNFAYLRITDGHL